MGTSSLFVGNETTAGKEVSLLTRSNASIILYNETTFENPAAVDLNKKGASLNKLGRYGEAITYFDKALELYPNFDTALSNKGIAIDSLGRHYEAITYYNKALKIDPNNYLALSAKGSTLAGLGKYDEAITYYDKALQIEPNNPVVLDNKRTLLEIINEGK
jgi:tetratricopeptide (TPR) repeat protein